MAGEHNGGYTAGSSDMGKQSHNTFVLTRRRRLILEADLDDDALEIDRPPIAEETGGRKLGPMQGGDGGVEGVLGTAAAAVAGRVQLTGVVRSGGMGQAEVGRALKLGDGPARPRLDAANAGKKGRLRKAGPPKKVSPSPMRGPVGEVGMQRAGVPIGPAKGSGPSEGKIRALVLADSDSEEEAQCFEIKRRPSTAKMTNHNIAIPRGHVNQVVAAFEAGMDITDDQEPVLQPQELSLDPERSIQGEVQDGAPQLDEYGSNLMNPTIGTRKRPLDAMGGELGDNPVPKKQFVEDEENLNQVEEASHKGPQSDK
ncbi:unnamed protein product [Linum trigynum]